jgi:hypothetical protein
MDLVSYAIVSLDNVKSFIGITNSQHDELLKFLINQATDYIESYTGRRFVDTTYTEEKYDGNATQDLVLKQFPVTATETFKLEKNNNFDNTDNWEEVDTDNYWVDNSEGCVHKISLFNLGKQNYRVTYSAGYDTVPFDLQFLACSLVGEIFNKRRAMGIKSEKLGDHSITFAGELAANESLQNIIGNYRKIPI